MSVVVVNGVASYELCLCLWVWSMVCINHFLCHSLGRVIRAQLVPLAPPEMTVDQDELGSL